jgi:O-antigen/teichoic acid export membrane protein
MLEQLLRSTFLYGWATLISRGSQLVLIPIYTRMLSPGEFGVVDMVAIFGALVNLTVALEISQGVARYLADARNESDRLQLYFDRCGLHGCCLQHFC